MRAYELRKETWGWDYRSKTDAKSEVEAVLKRDVEQDWTEHEVENLVDDVLADWDEDNDGG